MDGGPPGASDLPGMTGPPGASDLPGAPSPPGASDPAAPRPTVADWLATATRRLAGAGAENPDLDARRLLESALGLEGPALWTRPDRRLTFEEGAVLDALLAGRARGAPLQHLTRRAAFRHLDLEVGPGVFVPRPETEGLVDRVLEFLDRSGNPRPRILDLCTGSGAILAALLSERPAASGVGVDLSRLALEYARVNLRSAGAFERALLLEGDLFEPVAAGGEDPLFDAITANPPYIPDPAWEGLPVEVRDHEPRLALLGGPQGTDLIRRIVAGAPPRLRAGGLLALEIDETHRAVVLDLLGAGGAWAETRIEEDLAGRPRYALATRASG